MTTIAQMSGKWYVVKSKVINGLCVWSLISQGYDTSEQARHEQANIVFGRV